MIPTLSAPEQAHHLRIIRDDLYGIKGAATGANPVLLQLTAIDVFQFFQHLSKRTAAALWATTWAASRVRRPALIPVLGQRVIIYQMLRPLAAPQLAHRLHIICDDLRGIQYRRD